MDAQENQAVPETAPTTSEKPNKETVTLTPCSDREKYLNAVMTAVARTGKVFAMHGRVYTDRGGRLQVIDQGNTLARLIGRLVNLVKVSQSGESHTIDPAVGEASFILHSPELLAMLPQITYIADVPVIDQHGEIVQPGHNASSGIYYDGPQVEPSDSLAYLNPLLDVFCWKRPVDRVNYLGFLLTPFLGPRFRGGRPIALIKGNQPEVGKSEAGKVIAIIGSANKMLLSCTYKHDDVELEKEIAAIVRQTNTILVDNVKSERTISSPCIERTITTPTYNFRRVGTSETVTGENYVQFVITYNGGALSADLSTRSVYLLMEYVGDPRKRAMPAIGEPSDYARNHRIEIIASLLGMLVNWRKAGMPQLPVACRFRPWAMLLNGILTANRAHGFLSTHLGDAREGDERQVVLEELAIARPNEFLRPAEWLGEFQRLRLLHDHLVGKSVRSQQTLVGNLLKTCTGRDVVVDVGENTPCTVFTVARKDDRNGALYGLFRPKEQPVTAPGGAGGVGNAGPMEVAPE